MRINDHKVGDLLIRAWVGGDIVVIREGKAVYRERYTKTLYNKILKFIDTESQSTKQRTVIFNVESQYIVDGLEFERVSLVKVSETEFQMINIENGYKLSRSPDKRSKYVSYSMAGENSGLKDNYRYELTNDGKLIELEPYSIENFQQRYDFPVVTTIFA